MEIFFTRSRPSKKNDQAMIESKNKHLVRKHAFYYRYDVDEERAVLNRLRTLINDRLNYLSPHHQTDRLRLQPRRSAPPPLRPAHDPLDRLLAAGVVSPAQEPELLAYRDTLNPAEIARRSADLHNRLLILAKENRAALPDQHPHRPTRRPRRHPHQGFLKPTFAGTPCVMHGSDCAGILI
jgi:hypothetical protein